MSNKPFLHMFDITKCTSISASVATTGEIACPTTSVCITFKSFFNISSPNWQPWSNMMIMLWHGMIMGTMVIKLWSFHESWPPCQETWPPNRHHGMIMTKFRHDHGNIMAWQTCFSNLGLFKPQSGCWISWCNFSLVRVDSPYETHIPRVNYGTMFAATWFNNGWLAAETSETCRRSQLSTFKPFFVLLTANVFAIWELFLLSRHLQIVAIKVSLLASLFAC